MDLSNPSHPMSPYNPAGAFYNPAHPMYHVYGPGAEPVRPDRTETRTAQQAPRPEPDVSKAEGALLLVFLVIVFLVVIGFIVAATTDDV